MSFLQDLIDEKEELQHSLEESAEVMANGVPFALEDQEDQFYRNWEWETKRLAYIKSWIKVCEEQGEGAAEQCHAMSLKGKE